MMYVLLRLLFHANFFMYCCFLFAPISAVFSMPEGKLLSFIGLIPPGTILDVPNAMLGTIYYTLTIIRENFLYNKFPSTLDDVDIGRKRLHIDQTILFIASGAMSASVFLAFRLTQLKELCVLCWSTHAINLSLFVIFISRVKAMGRICRGERYGLSVKEKTQ